MSPDQLLLIYCVAVIGSSLFGGALPSLIRLTHVRMQCLLSLVGGFVLGVALLHMIPHGVHACGSLDLVIQWTLIGLLVTFFMIRLFHFHQHGPAAQPTDDGSECDHPEHDHHHHDHSGREVNWTGVLLGLSLHTLMDGVAMAAAVVAEAEVHPGHWHAWPWGFGVFLAVFLHKPLDALSITGLMANGTRSSRTRHLVNFGFSLMCPLGALLFVSFANSISSDASMQRFMGMGMGFSAGVFLCISLSDLLPEVQFHRHDRGKLSLSLLLGVALAYGIGFLEGGHGHGESGTPTHHSENTDAKSNAKHQHLHDGHDHAGHDH